MIKNIIYQYKSAYSGLPGEAWLLALTVLINRSGSMVLFFMAIYLTSQLGFTVSKAGQMISIYGAGALIGAFAGGWLSDLIGSIRVQMLSLFFSGIGYLLLAYMTDTFTIAALLFVIAIVSESFRPANATALSTFCPPEIRSRGFALNRLAINLGVTIGPAVGGFLATIDYIYLFWVDGITYFGAAILVWIFFHEKIKKYVSTKKTFSNTQISPWKDKLFLSTLLILLIIGLSFFQLFTTWPLYLKNIYSFVEDRIGLLLAINAIFVVIVEMPLIHKLERKNIFPILGIGGFLLLLGFGLLPFGNSFIYVAFTVIIWTIGEMLVFPFFAAYVANRASDANRGKYMGMFNFTFALAFVIGPYLGSWVYNSFGAEILWYAIGLTGIPVMFGFFILNRRSI